MLRRVSPNVRNTQSLTQVVPCDNVVDNGEDAASTYATIHAMLDEDDDFEGVFKVVVEYGDGEGEDSEDCDGEDCDGEDCDGEDFEDSNGKDCDGDGEDFQDKDCDGKCGDCKDGDCEPTAMQICQSVHANERSVSGESFEDDCGDDIVNTVQPTDSFSTHPKLATGTDASAAVQAVSTTTPPAFCASNVQLSAASSALCFSLCSPNAGDKWFAATPDNGHVAESPKNLDMSPRFSASYTEILGETAGTPRSWFGELTPNNASKCGLRASTPALPASSSSQKSVAASVPNYEHHTNGGIAKQAAEDKRLVVKRAKRALAF